MSTTQQSTHSALNPDDAVIYGPQIDRDLGITDRGRRKMISRGVLPPPDGYLGGRAFWRASRYAAFKAELFGGKHGQQRRPGAAPAQAA
jgi:hypothetical protein